MALIEFDLNSGDLSAGKAGRNGPRHLAIALGGALWGSMGLLVRALGARGWAALDISAGRATVALVLLAAWLTAFRPRFLRVQRRDLRYFLLAGVCGTGITGPLFVFCLLGVPLAVAVLLNNSAPVYAAVLARPLLGERLDGRRVAALGLQLGGLALVTGLPFLAGSPATPMRTGAVLAGLASGLAYAINLLATRRLAPGYPPATLQFWSVSMGLPVLLAIRVLGTGLAPIPPVDPGAALACLLLAAAWIGGHLLVSYGLARVQAAPAAILLTVEPLVAVLLGWVVLRERLAPLQLVGMVLVLAAIGMVSAGRQHPSPRSRGVAC